MKLKDYLKTNKIQKQKFAKTLGISRPTLNNYINNKRVPLIAKLAIEFISGGEVRRNDWISN